MTLRSLAIIFRNAAFGLALGLAILTALRVFYQPSQTNLETDVASFRRTIEHDGFANPRLLGSSLDRMRKHSGGRIAWIQLRDENGALVAQSGYPAPLDRVSLIPIVVISYAIPLKDGSSATLDIAIHVKPAASSKRPVPQPILPL